MGFNPYKGFSVFSGSKGATGYFVGGDCSVSIPIRDFQYFPGNDGIYQVFRAAHRGFNPYKGFSVFSGGISSLYSRGAVVSIPIRDFQYFPDPASTSFPDK